MELSQGKPFHHRLEAQREHGQASGDEHHEGDGRERRELSEQERYPNVPPDPDLGVGQRVHVAEAGHATMHEPCQPACQRTPVERAADSSPATNRDAAAIGSKGLSGSRRYRALTDPGRAARAESLRCTTPSFMTNSTRSV